MQRSRSQTRERLVSAVKTYQVIVRPGEKYWILEIPGIGFTQARTTAEIESMARDLITVMTQDADFALTVETKLPQSVQEHLDEARRLRKEEAECRSNAARETRAAAQELHGMGLALQQIGDILGVSRQRAHQLVNAHFPGIVALACPKPPLSAQHSRESGAQRVSGASLDECAAGCEAVEHTGFGDGQHQIPGHHAADKHAAGDLGNHVHNATRADE